MHLTEHMIIARSKESDLSTIRRINLWGCDLTDISIVKKMTNIEILALSVNNLSCLQPLEACTKLQELYLRKNNIQDFRQLLHLRKLPSLTNLWLAENPCCSRAGANYRAWVLNMLPNLKKLDDEVVTADDIEKAKKLNCTDLETGQFESTLTQDSTQRHGSVAEQSSLPFGSPVQSAEPEQHSISASNKSNAFEQALVQDSVQPQSTMYKGEAFKYEETQAPVIEQVLPENTQSTNPYPSELLEQPVQHFNKRYSLPVSATARSDGGALMPSECQPLNEHKRSQSINHLSAHGLSMNMAQQERVSQSDLLEFEQTRPHQMEPQTPQYQTPPPQASSPQAYQMQMPMQSPQQQHQRSAMQNPPPLSYATTQPQQSWPQQEPLIHLQTPPPNQRTPVSSKTNRWPAASHLDISQATELDLALKMPRSYSMQTINEHAEWEDDRCVEDFRSIPNHQRYSNPEAAHSFSRDNMNVALTGSASARNAEPEHWDDGSLTSRTRTVPPTPPNREFNRYEASRSSRSRPAQAYQRDLAADDGTQSARTRFSQSTNQDYDGDDDLRSYRTDRTGATLSSRNLRRRNMHVLSALLCIIHELDLESLQVLEHNIVCRMDELSSS